MKRKEESLKKTNPKTNGYMSLVPAVEQANRILMYLASVSGTKVNLSEICRNVGILASKGLAILNTLQKSGFVSRDTEGKVYSLGPGLVSLGQKALDGLNHRDLAKPILQKLALETACTALLGVISDEYVVVTGVEEPVGAVVAKFRVGDIRPLFYRAQGLALAASLPEEEREKILAGQNPSYNKQNPAFDPDYLRREFNKFKQNGFLLDISPHNELVKVLVSAVLGPTAFPVGTLMLIGVFPKSDVRSYGRKLVEGAKQLSALLGGDNK
jgi:DNA-binding IclR family transcriptional regulator